MPEIFDTLVKTDHIINIQEMNNKEWEMIKQQRSFSQQNTLLALEIFGMKKRTQEKASVNEKFTPVQWGNNTYTEFTLKSGLF